MSGETPPPPAENPLLLGHDAAERAFLDAWNAGRLAHAWLIAGPRGVGKATLAFRMARFVLAQGEGAGGGLFRGPEALDLPEDDPVFRRVAGGGHGDLRVVERGRDDKGKRRSEIVVDDVRGIGHFLSLTPAEGGWRVVIIDAADEMNRNAANAVLKVLEEPPAHALLLLIAHSPGRLLPTIRSRCRRLTLRPLPEGAMAELLRRYRPDLGDGDVAVLARLGEGSIGRALSLAGQGGLELYRGMIDLLGGLPRLDVAKLHAFADRMGRAGGEESFRILAELFSWWLARVIRAGARGEAVDEAMPGEAEAARRLLGAAPLDQWVELWEKTARLFARAGAVHLDRKQVVLEAFLTVERLASP